jgi:EpsI family protein
MHKARPFLPAIILLIGYGSILQTRSQRAVPLGVPVGSIAPMYGDFQITDQVLSPDEVAVAGMTDYSARSYSSDGSVAFTTLVSYYDRQTQGRTIHSPRNCLPGAGWEVLTPGTKELDVGGAKYVVNHYVLKNGTQTALVLYWYQGRGRVVANEYRVKWDLLKDAALEGHTEEALVRVVVPVADEGFGLDSAESAKAMYAADSTATSVAVTLLRAVGKALPRA